MRLLDPSARLAPWLAAFAALMLASPGQGAEAPAPAVVASLPEKALDVLPLASGVYGLVWREPLADPIESNVLVVVNDADVLVVDSCLFPSSARRVAAEIRRLTPKPVRTLVNTHWHDDHHGGNAVFAELWPGLEIVAHAETRAAILEHTYAARPKVLAQYREESARMARWAESGVDDDGKPLVERRRKRAGELAALLATSVAELGSAREMPPSLTFDDSLVLHRGGRTIEVRWLGRGNTAGDTVVVLPQERIAATGDLLVAPIPFGFGSYYREWIETLGRLDALPVDTLFLAHGAPQRDRAYLHQVQGLLRSLVDETKAAVAAGLSLEATREKVRLAEWRARFVGTGESAEALGRAFDAFVLAPAVARAWRQARGEDPPEGSDE